MLEHSKVKIFFLLTFLLPSVIIAQNWSNYKITIVNSELTKQFLHQQNDLYNPIYDWEIFFLNHKISYEVIDDTGLDDYDFKDTDVLILPSVEVLSDDTKENLKELLNLGAGVLILGRLGEFNEMGKEKETDFLYEISGIKANLLENQKSNSWHLNIKNSNILSKSSLLKNLQVLNQFPVYYNEARIMSNQILAHFNETINESETRTIYPAITTVEYGYGKIIWFGFQLSQISPSESEINPLNELIFNSINCLAKKPAVWVNQFPHNYNSVSLFTFKVEDIKLFTEQILPILKAQQITSVFLIEPTEIINSYEYLSELCSVGEIVVHFDNLKMLDKFRNEIEELLIKSIQVLKDNTQQKSIGLFINNLNDPSEYSFLFEETSFNFFIDNNFRIYVKEVDSRSYKKLNNFEYGKMDLTPGLNNESKELFGAEFYVQLESSDITNIFLPSKNYPGSDLSASDIISECNSKFFDNSIWITSYSNLIDWIDKRQNMNVNLEESTTGNMLTINLSYSGKELVEQVGLVLSLPNIYRDWEAITKDYSLRYDRISKLHKIRIPLIKPNQTLFIDLRYEQ
jgi:hypothetical protein